MAKVPPGRMVQVKGVSGKWLYVQTEQREGYIQAADANRATEEDFQRLSADAADYWEALPRAWAAGNLPETISASRSYIYIQRLLLAKLESESPADEESMRVARTNLVVALHDLRYFYRAEKDDVAAAAAQRELLKARQNLVGPGSVVVIAGRPELRDEQQEGGTVPEGAIAKIVEISADRVVVRVDGRQGWVPRANVRPPMDDDVDRLTAQRDGHLDAFESARDREDLAAAVAAAESAIRVQRMLVETAPALARTLSTGWKATLFTDLEWPESVVTVAEEPAGC